MTEVTEGVRHKMEVQNNHIVEEVDKLRNTIDRCTHPLVSIFPHGPRWVWISPYRLLISPLVWKVPIVPHCHVSSRVTLLTVLLSIWVCHFLSIQTTGKQSCY